MTTTAVLLFTVGQLEATSRLDAYLCARDERFSRRSLKQLCRDKQVLLNGRPTEPGARVKPGDELQVLQLPQAVTARAGLVREQGGAEKFVRVVFEDEHLIIISKPRQMPSITLTAEDPITAADCLAEHCESCLTASADPRESGLVQRLDSWTSGLLLAAKTPECWRRLREMLTNGEIRKEYHCLVEGEIRESKLDLDFPLEQSKGGTKMVVSSQERIYRGKAVAARTEVFVLKIIAECHATVVKVLAPCARRHQIRVHLAESGHPLAGDDRYGAKTRLEAYLPALGSGFLLQARALEFQHPFTAAFVAVTDDSPELLKLLS